MGWETRRGREHYCYTRSRRVDGRVARDYLGTGLLADLAAAQDEQERRSRAARVRLWRREQERLDALGAQLDRTYALTETLAAGTLLVAGYHRHARGEWRKRRG